LPEENTSRNAEINLVVIEMLRASMTTLPVVKRLEAVLLLILEVPWLSLEKKGCVFLTDDTGAGLVMVASHNLSAPLLDMCSHIKFGQCLCGKAAATQELVFRHCIDDDHTHRPSGMQPHGHYNIPIIKDNETLGVLNLYVKEGHVSTELECDFLNISADVMANLIVHEQALKDEKDRYHHLFEASADATLFIENRVFVACNDAAVRALGFSSKEELLRKHPRALSPDTQQDGRSSFEKANTLIDAAFEEGSVRFEWEYLRKDGSVFPVQALMTAVKYRGDELLHIVWHDITEMKKQKDLLVYLAHYDNLTGLPNRVLFADRFGLATAHAKRSETQLAVCFLDLDGFKPINDDYGHEIGDEVLKEVASRISKTIRDEDTVSRQGGDEFAMLLGNLKSAQQCEKLINRILSALAAPYIIDERELNVTASCGVTLYPADEKDIDTLLRHADQAMYDAKLLGRNTFTFFDANTEQLSQEHAAFLSLISTAIKRDEFLLFYQPKINMRTGKMFGLEALIRWDCPHEGIIPPYDFLPQIENTQVMIDVGCWVIEAALVQIEKWFKAGKNWVVSINIDAHHFMQKGFFKELKQSLESHPDVPPELLEIEILETVAFDDIEEVAVLIRQCQSLGVSFALDDFGTGYSSLTYLKKFPVQWLKIDRTFVRDMLEDEQDHALIEGVVSLAEAFKRDVIAEGVETVEHGEALIALGCYNAQGYGIAKPMPAENVVDWESSYKTDNSWTEHAKFSLIENEV